MDRTGRIGASTRFTDQVGSSRVPALVPAAGVDIRLARGSFARIEMRNYLYKTPATGFVSSFVYCSGLKQFRGIDSAVKP